MTTFGMDEWLNAGRTLLDAPIPAEQYMDLILERQRVYEAAHPPVKWVRTLPEWVSRGHMAVRARPRSTHRRGHLMTADPLTPAEAVAIAAVLEAHPMREKHWMRWVQELRAIANEAPPAPERGESDDLAQD